MTTITTSQSQPLLKIRPTRGWVPVDLREIWRFRELLFTLAGRDLKLRYKQTALGAIWVIIQPLLATLIFFFAFGILGGMAAREPHYFLKTFTAMLGWSVFAGTLSKSSGSLVGNAHLISKVFFPRLLLPLAAVPSMLVDLAISLGVLGILMAFGRTAPGPQLLLLPVWLLLLLMLAEGVGMTAAALSVSYRDVQYVLPVFVQMLQLASPVAYRAALVPARYRQWFYLNPVSALLEGFGWSIRGGPAPPWGAVVYSTLVATIVLLGGTVLFKRMERKFADVI